jgi:hypothetical protein
VLEICLWVVPKSEGASTGRAPLRPQELACRRQVGKRDDDVVPSALKGGSARVDRISRGVALSQRPAASRLDGPQQVFSGGSLLDHSPLYGPTLDVGASTTEVLLVCRPDRRGPLLSSLVGTIGGLGVTVAPCSAMRVWRPTHNSTTRPQPTPSHRLADAR